MFSSYEEADELRFECSICNKHKMEIIGHPVDGHIHYSVQRCRSEACAEHCHGHEVGLEVVVDLDKSYEAVPVLL